MLLTCAAPLAAAAEGGIDLRGWLDRPGVKLVAVEFYATWCKPCMDAVPRWKALHERFRDRGLRLIVVSTRDPEGACVNPGWNPDEMVCDPEGDTATALRVGSRLPAAFLWSWQGHLLVRRGHVDEVEREVERYLRKAPRVLVRAGGGRRQRGPAELVRHEVAKHGKLEVLASHAERKALRELRRDSHDLPMDESLACELGQEVSANSLLEASVGGAKDRRRLNLLLLSAESACLLASATAPWSRRQPERSVAEAVHKLLGRLRGRLEMPGAAMPAARWTRRSRPS